MWPLPPHPRIRSGGHTRSTTAVFGFRRQRNYIQGNGILSPIAGINAYGPPKIQARTDCSYRIQALTPPDLSAGIRKRRNRTRQSIVLASSSPNHHCRRWEDDMKRPHIATLLSIVSIWLSACPLLLLLMVFPPQEIVESFVKFDAVLLGPSVPFVKTLTLPLVFWLTVAASAVVAVFALWKQQSPQRPAGLIVLTVVWQLLLVISLLGYSLPMFKMGEVVSDESGQETSQSGGRGLTQ